MPTSPEARVVCSIMCPCAAWRWLASPALQGHGVLGYRAQATLPNHWARKYFNGVRPSNGPLHLHLGCGPKYLKGFVNIDANPFNQIDLWLDVRDGLPFPANSADSIYSTHMFEHFYPDELQQLLKECFRVLRPGGGIRLIVPSLSSAIVAYAKKRHDWFYDDYPPAL